MIGGRIGLWLLLCRRRSGNKKEVIIVMVGWCQWVGSGWMALFGISFGFYIDIHYVQGHDCVNA